MPSPVRFPWTYTDSRGHGGLVSSYRIARHLRSIQRTVPARWTASQTTNLSPSGHPGRAKALQFVTNKRKAPGSATGPVRGSDGDCCIKAMQECHDWYMAFWDRPAGQQWKRWENIPDGLRQWRTEWLVLIQKEAARRSYRMKAVSVPAGVKENVHA